MFCINLIIRAGHFIRCIFTEIQFCLSDVPVIFVKPICRFIKPFRHMIAMLIDQDFMIQSFCIIPEWLSMFLVRSEPCAHNAEDIRIFIMDRLADDLKFVDIILAVVFIADADPLQAERSRMAHVRPKFCPGR